MSAEPKVEQLALAGIEPAPPKLTERQAVVLEHLQRAGQDGLDADQAGAIAHGLKDNKWRHGHDDRCAYCGMDGMQIMKALKTKGLARYRRGTTALSGTWLAAGVAAGEPEIPHPAGMLRDDEDLPF